MALIAYSDQYLNWQLGEGHPTNPERARLAVEMLISSSLRENIHMLEGWDSEKNFAEWRESLLTVHDPDYVNRVLDDGICGDWSGQRTDLGQTALTMFGGTYSLVSEYLAGGDHRVYFNPQGAKHHAQWGNSSGFCVFNDMAAAALRLTAAGKSVVYVDWDAHAGDGVENILADEKDIWTLSIHEGNLFPWSGFTCDAGRWNYPLPDNGSDLDMWEAMQDVCAFLRETSPDVVLVACGADGLADDPLSTLLYTLDGMDESVRLLGRTLRDIDATAIVGGAGGYQPLTETPAHWARTIKILTKELEG